MKEELIKYVMGKADQCYADDFPIDSIEIWIREFFDQYQLSQSNQALDELTKQAQDLDMGY